MIVVVNLLKIVYVKQIVRIVAAMRDILGMTGIFLMFTGPMFLIAIWYIITVL